MLRQICRLVRAQKTCQISSIPRCMSSQDNEKYFDDSLLPKVSKEGVAMRDPRDIDDPDYDNPVGNVESENFTFDSDHGIGQVKKAPHFL